MIIEILEAVVKKTIPKSSILVTFIKGVSKTTPKSLKKLLDMVLARHPQAETTLKVFFS